MDLVRLAIPRRTYTQSHIDYVIEVCEAVAPTASQLRGMTMISGTRSTAAFHPPAWSSWTDAPRSRPVRGRLDNGPAATFKLGGELLSRQVPNQLRLG